MKVFIGRELLPRDEAKVSVWDSGFQSGDAVYEGLRVYGGRVFRLHEHVDRLFSCAHAIGICSPMSRRDVCDAILDTVRANGLHDDAHVRVTMTRGDKPVTGMNPTLARASEPLLVVIAEPKPLPFPESGIRLITASIRRTPAQCLDPKLHTCNQLGQILAKMEANLAGVDEALMLDVNGFVAETNSANIFVATGGRLLTPRRNSCMPGLTRQFVLEVGPESGYATAEEDISQADVYSASEVFICGTVCEIVPVTAVDGRQIGNGKPGPISTQLRKAYARQTSSLGVPVT